MGERGGASETKGEMIRNAEERRGAAFISALRREKYGAGNSAREKVARTTVTITSRTDNRNTNRELTSACAKRQRASIFGESPLKRATLITREYGMLTRDEYMEKKKKTREREETEIERETRWRKSGKRARVGRAEEEEEGGGGEGRAREGRAGGETVIIDDDWQRGHRRRWV